MSDFRTILWKEWKEIFSERSFGKGNMRWLVLIGIMGIFMPYQAGLRFFQPQQLIIYLILPVAAIAAIVADAFAGERERHTLETLLASRLSDRTILCGKIGASIGYGWGLSMACLVMGLITVNLKYGDGKLLMFDLPTGLGTVLLAPLTGGVMACAGVLVSLHASTVRQAQQTLVTCLMVVVFGSIFGIRFLPDSWKVAFAHAVTTWGETSLLLAGAAILLGLDLLLLLAAMARFQRAKLILD